MIKSFNKTAHFQELRLLLDLRRMDSCVLTDIPEMGAVYYSPNAQVVAMGFIRKVEGNYGLLDSYISNPQMSSEDRNEALNKITAYLITAARISGISKLFAFSSEKSIIERACRHGFYRVSYEFTALDLKGDSCHS